MRHVIGLALLAVAGLAGCSPSQRPEPKAPAQTDAVATLQTDLMHSFPNEHPDLSVLRNELSHSLPADGVSILSAEMAYTVPVGEAPSARKARSVVAEPEPETPVLVTWGYTEPETDATDESEEKETETPAQQPASR